MMTDSHEQIWLDRTVNLTDGQYRALSIIVYQIALRGGNQALYQERFLAASANQHILAFRHNVSQLVASGLLCLEGGRVSAVDADLVPRQRSRNYHQPPPNPPPDPRPTPPPTPPRLPGGSRRKSLKSHLSNTESLSFFKKEKVSLFDANASNKAGDSNLDSPGKQYFDRGKQMFGQSAGGFLNDLLKTKGGNVALARADLEIASTKQNPREWIGAVLKNTASRSNGGGSGGDSNGWSHGI